MSASAIRAGAAYIELTVRDYVSKPLHAASVALKDFGNSVAWQGAKVAAMGAAITAPLAAMAHSFATSAIEMGRVGNRRDAAAVMGYVQALMRLSNAFAELRNAIGSAVLPLMAKWPNTLARIISQLAAWVRANRGLVQTIARFGSVLVAAGTALVFVGKGIAMLGSVFGVLSTVTSVVATGIAMLGTLLVAILSPVGMVIAGVVALGAYLLYASGVGEQALKWLGGAFGQLHADATQAAQGIFDALATGDIMLAGQIFWDALKLEWARGVDFINQIWISATEFFTGLWRDASYGVSMLLTDPWYVMESAYNETISFMQQGWLSFTGFLTKNLNWAVGELEKMWVKFRKWMGADIDVDARIKQIDETTAGANNILTDQTNKAKSDAEARRDRRRAEIEANRTPEGQALGRDWQAQADADRQRFQQQREQSRESVKTAKRELDDSTKKAADQRKAYIEPPPPPVELPQMLAKEQSKLDSKGTFNALAARGLGSDSLADRTAKATEATADGVKKLLGQAQGGGIVFS